MAQPTRVTLPGGACGGSRVRRDVVIKPLTGDLEQALGEAAAVRDNLPGRVTSVLELALESVGGEPADRRLCGSLCVADRRYLMLRLAQLADGDLLWLHPACEACGEIFDVSVERSALPVVPAGPGYPLAAVDLDDRRLHLRVPNGDDQEAVADLDDEEALRVLLGRCIEVEPAGFDPDSTRDPISTRMEDPLVQDLGEDELAVIDAALDAVSPDVGTVTLTRCPECGAEQQVRLDPYEMPGLDLEQLYREVHNLAIWYHWNEPQILALPRERRRLYSRFIDQSRGMHV